MLKLFWHPAQHTEHQRRIQHRPKWPASTTGGQQRLRRVPFDCGCQRWPPWCQHSTIQCVRHPIRLRQQNRRPSASDGLLKAAGSISSKPQTFSGNGATGEFKTQLRKVQHGRPTFGDKTHTPQTCLLSRLSQERLPAGAKWGIKRGQALAYTQEENDASSCSLRTGGKFQNASTAWPSDLARLS